MYNPLHKIVAHRHPPLAFAPASALLASQRSSRARVLCYRPIVHIRSGGHLHAERVRVGRAPTRSSPW
eukprot:4634752-Prymnesium_polylepis.1